MRGNVAIQFQNIFFSEVRKEFVTPFLTDLRLKRAISDLNRASPKMYLIVWKNVCVLGEKIREAYFDFVAPANTFLLLFSNTRKIKRDWLIHNNKHSSAMVVVTTFIGFGREPWLWESLQKKSQHYAWPLGPAQKLCHFKFKFMHPSLFPKFT